MDNKTREIYNKYLSRNNKKYFNYEFEVQKFVFDIRNKFNFEEKEIFDEFLLKYEKMQNEKIIDLIQFIIASYNLEK